MYINTHVLRTCHEKFSRVWNKVYIIIHTWDQIYSCGGPREMEISRPLLITTNLGYENNLLLFLFVIITKNTNLRSSTFRVFRVAMCQNLWILLLFCGCSGATAPPLLLIFGSDCTVTLLLNWKAEGRKLNAFYWLACSSLQFVPPQFPNLSTWSAKLTVMQMRSEVQKSKCAVVSRFQVCGYSAKTLSYGVWKSNTNKSGAIFFY